MDRVKDKVALVTGGAAGIGKEVALLLAEEGAKIVVTDIDENGGNEVAEKIQSNGSDAIFIKHDVVKEDDWKKVIEQTLQKFGKMDILVNNAGVGLPDDNIETISLDDWRWLMSINLDGVFLGTKYGIEAMKKNGGSIINMSSIAGIVGDPHLTAYCASKGGVRTFTKSAALQCARAGYNIRVNSVHPGFIWTPLVEAYSTIVGNGDVEKGRKLLDRLFPIGHMGEARDVAYSVLYLASDESKFVTGSELVVDGGFISR